MRYIYLLFPSFGLFNRMFAKGLRNARKG